MKALNIRKVFLLIEDYNNHQLVLGVYLRRSTATKDTRNYDPHGKYRVIEFQIKTELKKQKRRPK